MDAKTMAMLPKPDVGLDLEIQVENALKGPGMVGVRDLLSSLSSSIPGATLASGSALALLASLYFSHRSTTTSTTSTTTTTSSSTALAALTAEYEAYRRVQGKKYAALQSENTALQESHAAYRRESLAMKTRVVQLVSEAHLRTEDGLKTQIQALEEEKKVLGRAVQGYAKQMWDLKSENRSLRNSRIVELEESGHGGDEGVGAENARLKAENTELQTQTTRLEAQNTSLERKNTVLETELSATESENAILKRKHTELTTQNTELVSKTSQLQNSLSKITDAHDAALSENQGLRSALQESHDAVKRADEKYTSGVQSVKKLFAHAKEEQRTELAAKTNEITTLRANLTLKSTKEAILQEKLEQAESELNSKAEETAKLEAERDAIAEKAIDRQHQLLVTKTNLEKEIATRTEGLRAELNTANANLQTSTAAKLTLENQITEATETRSKLEAELAQSKSLQSTTATKLAVFRDSWAVSKNAAIKKQKEGDEAKLAELGSRIVDLETRLDSAIASRDASKISEKDFERRLRSANDEIETMKIDHEDAVVEYELKLETLGAMIAARDDLNEVSNVDDAGSTTPQEEFSGSEADAVENPIPSKPKTTHSQSSSGTIAREGERANNNPPPSSIEAEDADTPKSSPSTKIPQVSPSPEPKPQSSPDAEKSPSHLPVRRLLPYNLGSITHPFPASPRHRKIFLPPGDGPFYFEDDPTPYYPDANRRPVAQGKKWGEALPSPKHHPRRLERRIETEAAICNYPPLISGLYRLPNTIRTAWSDGSRLKLCALQPPFHISISSSES
ncbi:hypothetical protein G7Y79_00010g027960 [Physcia stellaris]|nr:hypothetical protein G7Y79_00010g027960 [Physcia stellaris]